jgi:hypothetical protein
MGHTTMSRRDVLALMLAMGVPSGSALAGETTTAGGLSRRVALENNAVRALDFVSAPQSGACGPGAHWHPTHLSIFLTPARLKVTRPDGTTAVSERKAGDVLWAEAGAHNVENVGDDDVRIVMVELKDKNWRPS